MNSKSHFGLDINSSEKPFLITQATVVFLRKFLPIFNYIGLCIFQCLSLLGDLKESRGRRFSEGQALDTQHLAQWWAQISSWLFYGKMMLLMSTKTVDVPLEVKPRCSCLTQQMSTKQTKGAKYWFVPVFHMTYWNCCCFFLLQPPVSFFLFFTRLFPGFHLTSACRYMLLLSSFPFPY